MRLTTSTPGFANDIWEVVRLFWPEAGEDGSDPALVHTHEDTGDTWIETWTMDGHKAVYTAKPVRGGLEEKRFLKRAVKSGCFELFQAITGVCPPWGSLTGIRPTRLLYEAEAAGLERAAAVDWLCDTFRVAPDRAALLSDILDMQKGLIGCEPNEFDLYIGIPFCVTRCAYCSFSSGVLGNGRLVEPYLSALFKELDAAAEIAKAGKLKIRACYMGGGTPTSLTASQLERTLERAMRLFPGAREWTVEAGRPDTIDRAKLSVMKEMGVGRISINPQTFSDETLARIGRAHSAAQIYEAYDLARGMGFDDINMDLIAALPGETEADFDNSLTEAIRLSPQSVTVHTLAVKRTSKLHEKGYRQAEDGRAARMVDRARERLMRAGYRPYYLYRQKHMADNLENVGYALPGKACVYNIDNMEETAPVMAVGACAITKWLFPRERRIERAANLRNIEAYIDRVDEMIARKRALILKEV